MVQKLNIRSDAAYGLTGPVLDNLAPVPVVAQRNPTIRDKGKPGTVWINQVLGTIFVVVKTAANQTTWASYSTQTGTFHSLDVDTGDITVDLGDVIISQGNLTLTAGALAVGGAIVSGSNVVVSGTVSATSVVSGSAVKVTGDPGSGTADTVIITSETDTDQSSGKLSILSDSTSSGNNAGFIKVYVGTDVAYIPYFTDISPT